MIVALGFVVTGCGGESPKPAPAPEATKPADPHAGHDHSGENAGADKEASK